MKTTLICLLLFVGGAPADITNPLVPWRLMPALSNSEVTTLALKDVVSTPVLVLPTAPTYNVIGAAGAFIFIEYTPGPTIELSRSTMIFRTDKGNIILDTETGDVTLPSGLKPSAAAKEFWRAVKMLRKYSQLNDE